jgi:tetratricopeptide (TPR) repeat protein
MADTLTNFELLEKRVWQGTPKYDFNSRIDIDKLETFEAAYGIVLSESYKQFMERFNGGMILAHPQSFYIDMLEDEPDGPKWSSYYFFDYDEVVEKYRDLRLDKWLLGDDFNGVYPIIPICRTPGPEHNLLFMFSEKGLNTESPVFAMFVNSNISSCVQVATGFDAFLEWYVNSEGFPPIGQVTGTISCHTFVDEKSIVEIAGQKETHLQIIERSTAMLKLFPDDSWSYCTRGNAHLYNGESNLALNDFNKAIELDENESFFYHCRGDLVLQYGSARKALIDLDIAVKLDSDNKMFLAGRADAFLKLGWLEKALADCNRILEKDSKYRLALYVRERVYKEMGEDELAQADSDLIDELS